MRICIPPGRIFYYGEDAHIEDFGKTESGEPRYVVTNLFAPKGFPAYQILSDNFYVINEVDGKATMTDGNGDDIVVFKNNNIIEVVRKSEFKMSEYGYGNSIPPVIWTSNLEMLNMRDYNIRNASKPKPIKEPEPHAGNRK